MSKVNINCKYCNKQFQRYKSQIKSKNIFCSKDCRYRYQKHNLIGSNNPNYKNGEWVDKSYCSCGNLKDPRSIQCAECAHKSFLRNNNITKWRAKDIYAIVQASNSFTEVANKLGVSRVTAKNIISDSDVNISHFRPGRGRPKPIEKYLIHSDIKRNGTIKKIILENDLLSYICSECKQGPIWNGKSLTLELDHINGNPYDNRLENLRFLCPCCHSQTSTSKGRNSKNAKKKRR